MKSPASLFCVTLLSALITAVPSPAQEQVAAQPSIKKLYSYSGSAFEVTYHWKVAATPSTDWRVFVHFVDETGTSKIAGDHEPEPPTSLWKPGNVEIGPILTSIPEGVTGTFEIRMGLYNDVGRAELPGPNDDQRRVIVGKILVDSDHVELLTGSGRGTLGIEPSIKSVESVSATQFKINYLWKVTQALKDDWTILVHFTDEKGETKFCADFIPLPGTGTSTWQAGEVLQGPCLVNVPAGISGVFDVRIGLYQRGENAALLGSSDDQQRIIAGQVKLTDGRIELLPARFR